MERPWAAHAWEPASLPPGTQVGPWRVVERRGRGSYGAVYRVERVGEEGEGWRALKLATYPREPRFVREGELLRRIRHAGVPALVEGGWWPGPGGQLYPYLVMSWAEGEGLYEWVQGHNPSSRQVLRVVGQVARALEATHEAGGVHRDVKGDNVLVGPEGRAFLTDFGAGTWAGAPVLTESLLPPGTREYRSPRALRYQWRFRREPEAHYEAEPGDDVYALGVTAYRVVTGVYPPPATDPEAREDRSRATVQVRAVPRALNARVARELGALIERMLSEEPEARGTAREVAEAAEEAAASAGPEADEPLAATERMRAEAVTEREGERVPPRAQTPEWGLLLAAAAVVVPPAVGAWVALHARPEELPHVVVELPQALVEAEEGEGSMGVDGGTSGLGNVVPAAPVGNAAQPSAKERIGLEMPPRPFPGQLRPDKSGQCPRKAQVAVNGGCWILLGNLKPPCADEGYEWKGGCYYPVFDMPKLPTSDEP